MLGLGTEGQSRAHAAPWGARDLKGLSSARERGSVPRRGSLASVLWTPGNAPSPILSPQGSADPSGMSLTVVASHAIPSQQHCHPLCATKTPFLPHSSWQLAPLPIPPFLVPLSCTITPPGAIPRNSAPLCPGQSCWQAPSCRANVLHGCHPPAAPLPIAVSP